MDKPPQNKDETITAYPYHYVRLSRSASAEKGCMMTNIEFRWSGQVIATVDGLVFIGRNPMNEPNPYIATGDSGNGMKHGTIAGMILTDLIEGRDNAWSILYDPARKTLGALKIFAKESLDMAAQCRAPRQ